MAWYTFVILFVVAIILKAFLVRPAFGKNYDEVLRFFSPDGKFTALEIAEIIKERTSGRRDISDTNVRFALDKLCKEGKLRKEIFLQNFGERTLQVHYYSLPPPPE